MKPYFTLKKGSTPGKPNGMLAPDDFFEQCDFPDDKHGIWDGSVCHPGCMVQTAEGCTATYKRARGNTVCQPYGFCATRSDCRALCKQWVTIVAGPPPQSPDLPAHLRREMRAAFVADRKINIDRCSEMCTD